MRGRGYAALLWGKARTQTPARRGILRARVFVGTFMTLLATMERPLRVAVIGSGPSGFYAAEALAKSGREVSVDIFDSLPCPFGLVRYGVAPDHQKIKSVTKVFDRIAARPNVRFLGNVTLGVDIQIEELRRFYDAVVLANGAQSDRRLNIPGEDLPGSHTATEFVAWYNGHPDYADRQFDLSQEAAVVIGQGNVAVDVCRVLAKTADELRETDIACHALDALAQSRVRRIYMVGRRGPVQAKFTQLEIKELGALPSCTALIDPAELELNEDSRADLAHPDNANASRIFPVLQEIGRHTPSPAMRNLHIVFRRSPTRILGGGRVESIQFEKNRLEGPPTKVRAIPTGQFEGISCGLVFRSVGYRGVPLPGIPFDTESGAVPNMDGRVTDRGEIVPGLYATGWIKRGPTGVIGTNKPDSLQTVELLIADIGGLTPCESPGEDTVLDFLNARGVRVVSFEDWLRIDALETERGMAAGRIREKIVRRADLLAAAAGAPARG
jgi:ferredoxin--NADP+ reductase